MLIVDILAMIMNHLHLARVMTTRAAKHLDPVPGETPGEAPAPATHSAHAWGNSSKEV
jgi:hypothetical protein